MCTNDIRSEFLFFLFECISRLFCSLQMMAQAWPNGDPILLCKSRKNLSVSPLKLVDNSNTADKIARLHN